MADEKPPPFVECSFTRVTSWIHWVKEERNENDDIYQDRQLMANDLHKFVEVANAAYDVLAHITNEKLSDDEKELKSMLEDLWKP